MRALRIGGLLLILAVFATDTAQAQFRKQPAQRAFAGGSGKLYTSADAVCTAEAVPVTVPYNFHTVNSSSCGSGSITQDMKSVMAYTGVGTDSNGGLACMYDYSTVYTVSGSPDCGTALGTWTTHDVGSLMGVGEVRVCDSAQGWTQWDQANCFRQDAPYPVAEDCPKCGNPTSVGSGAKDETFRIGTFVSASRAIPLELQYGNLFHHGGGAMLGERSWFLEPADRRLNLRYESGVEPQVTVALGHSESEVFRRNTDGTWKSFDPLVTLAQSGATWIRTDYREDSFEVFDFSGRFTQRRYFSGGGFDLAYADGQTILASTLTSTTGQQVVFTYSGSRLSAVTMPNGSVVNLAYQNYSDIDKNVSGSYLKTITYPDAKTVTFDYAPGMTLPIRLPLGNGISREGKSVWSVTPGSPNDGGNIGHPSEITIGRSFYNLTSITDELSVLLSEFAYDDYGRVTLSRRAGNTHRFEFTYSGGVTTVTQPLGLVSAYGLSTVNEQVRLANVSISGPSYSRYIGYVRDAQGNVTQRSDTLATRCSVFHATLNRPTLTLEGAAYCPADLPAHMPTGAERKISMQWDANRRLLTKIAEPGRITTYVYHGRTDPFNGNAIASCATGVPNLVDGRPLSLLCKSVQQATTDPDGRHGFGATLQSGVANRTEQWTYNASGQLLTARDPLNNLTSYAYYPSASFAGTDPNAVGHSLGDLWTVTNALNKVTTFRKYDKLGQLLEAIDANGVVTANTYDLRQRQLTRSVGSQTTTFMYDAAGQLTRITAPDASWIGYEYDPARRMTAVKDNLGNRIEYTLDTAGNRTAENVKDAGGVLRRQLARSFDAVGRVQQTSGRE